MTRKPTSSDFEPHDCPQCGRPATDPNPPRLIEGYIIDCPSPSCGPVSNEPATDSVDEILEIFQEEQQKRQPKKGVASGPRARTKKKVSRPTFRVEQEVRGLPQRDVATTERVEKLEHSLAITVPSFVLFRIDYEATRRHVSRSRFIREPLDNWLRANSPVVCRFRRSIERSRVQLRVGSVFQQALKAALSAWGLKRGRALTGGLHSYLTEYDADFQGWKEVTVAGR